MYLIKMKTVGRLLDLFMSVESKTGTTKNSDKFRNELLSLMVPLFKIEKEMYLKCNTERNDVVITLLERKSTMQSANPPFIFLLNTLSKLARSCVFVKET